MIWKIVDGQMMMDYVEFYSAYPHTDYKIRWRRQSIIILQLSSKPYLFFNIIIHWKQVTLHSQYTSVFAHIIRSCISIQSDFGKKLNNFYIFAKKVLSTNFEVKKKTNLVQFSFTKFDAPKSPTEI